MRSKGYDNTYNCVIIKSVPIENKCNTPLFHVSMWILIASFFGLAATTQYKPVEQYQTIASIGVNI